MKYLKLFENFDDNKPVVDALKTIYSCIKNGTKISSKINGGKLMDLHDSCEDPQVQDFLVKAAEVTSEEIQGTIVDLKDMFDINELEGLIRILEANPEKDESYNLKIESFSSFRNESLDNFHHISEEELNLFSEVPALQELITKLKVRLEKDKIHYNENDEETLEILTQYLDMPEKIEESVNTESYEEVSKALLDNFDDVRACSFYMDKLKEMGRLQEFLESEDGKLFKELRSHLR